MRFCATFSSDKLVNEDRDHAFPALIDKTLKDVELPISD